MKTISYFLYVFLVFALLPLSCIAPDAYSAIQRENWPTTEGKLLSKKLRTSSSKESGKFVEVEYEYTVDGKQHRGNNVAYGLEYKIRGEQQQAIFDKLKENGAVTVRYDPTDPAISTLAAGLSNQLKGRLVFAFTFLGIFICWFLMFRVFMATDENWSLAENLQVEK